MYCIRIRTITMRILVIFDYFIEEKGTKHMLCMKNITNNFSHTFLTNHVFSIYIAKLET